MADSVGFRITGGKGFHITFENGWTVSVQWGPGNYCDNHYSDFHNIIDASVKAGAEGSTTAECAVWKSGGGPMDMVQYPEWEGDTVSNRSTPAEVLELLNWAASQPAEEKNDVPS